MNSIGTLFFFRVPEQIDDCQFRPGDWAILLESAAPDWRILTKFGVLPFYWDTEMSDDLYYKIVARWFNENTSNKRHKIPDGRYLLCHLPPIYNASKSFRWCYEIKSG